MVVVANDGVIIGNRQNGLIVLLYKMCLSGLVIVFYPDISAETHFFCVLRTAKFEGVAVLQPVVRLLHLVTILNLLLEHAIAVADAAAVSRVPQGCQRIQEAGSQTSQAAISKSRVRLLVFQKI